MTSTTAAIPKEKRKPGRLSILHISDLHRDPADEILTQPLLDSLTRDSESFQREDPSIPLPDIAVVSGDLIFGVAHDQSDANASIKRQYEDSLSFLAGLADRFFGGNRERVVIVPGNHDVNATIFRESLSVVDASRTSTGSSRKRTVSQLFAAHSRVRWSWEDLSFYEVSNSALYERRLEAFSLMYEDFYRGHRKFALDPAGQLNVFDYPEFDLCVLGLSSCYNNDLFRRAGALHPAVVTEACKAARAVHRAGRLIVATWHHSVSGGPTRDDYLDSSALQLLIDSGVSMVLHGHQHVPEVVDERCRVGASSRFITLVSAGTLCAGPHHLAPAEPRSYNVVEIDTGSHDARAHLRAMINRDYAIPLWGPRAFSASAVSYVDFKVCPPATVRPVGLDDALALEAAERELGAGNHLAVVQLLADRPDPLARLLLTQSLLELGDHSLTIKTLSPATNPAEAVLLGTAMLETGATDEAVGYLNSPFVSATSDASVREIADKLRRKQAP